MWLKFQYQARKINFALQAPGLLTDGKIAEPPNPSARCQIIGNKQKSRQEQAAFL